MAWSEVELRVVLAQNPALRLATPDKPAGGMAERTLQQEVLRVAKAHGWLVYHTHDSRKSPQGFPDLVLAKPGHPLLLVELKSATGKLTHAQEVWLAIAAQATHVETHLWRPADLDAILALLTASR